MATYTYNDFRKVLRKVDFEIVRSKSMKRGKKF